MNKFEIFEAGIDKSAEGGPKTEDKVVFVGGLKAVAEFVEGLEESGEYEVYELCIRSARGSMSLEDWLLGALDAGDFWNAKAEDLK